MWRATVIEVIAPGWVVVEIPKLYRSDPVGPMQSAQNVNAGESVIVADLTPAAKTRDWWVLGRESEIGTGQDTPVGAHTHPMGDVDGLVTALEGKAAQSEYAATKADVDAATYLTTPSALIRRFTNGHIRVPDDPGGPDAVNATWVDTNYTSKTTYNNGMAAKADNPGAWTNCITSSYLTKETGADMQVRDTPFGVQIRAGRWRMATSIPMDATLFNLPTGFRPTAGTFFSFSGMAGGTYDAMQIHVEARTDGRVTMRHPISNGPLFTLGHTLYIN